MIGTDPEVFVIGGNKKVIPCVGLIPGTKEEPHPIAGHRHGLKIQEDGVTLEFNINAYNTVQTFASAVRQSVTDLKKIVRDYIPNANLHISPSHKFSEEDLRSEQAMTFGCDPDFNAWERGNMRRPPSVKEVGLNRFAGGHIHFGYDVKNAGIPPWALIQFIEVMGYGGYVLANGFDKQGERRKFYGLAGLYRVKDYGIEYRTPSNYWLADPVHMGVDTMYRALDLVLTRPEKARVLFKSIEAHSAAIQEAVSREVWPSELSKLYNKLWNDFEAVPAEREV